MKKILLAILCTFGIPAVSFAAAYQYVTTSGTLQTVSASSPTEALAIAPNIDSHSGVILLDGSTVPLQFVPNIPAQTSGTHLYQYVDINGSLRTVVADSPAQALMFATNIDPHSGVILL